MAAARTTRAALGAHMSIDGGVDRAVERALAVDATALQIFVRSARQWSPRPLAADEIARFREAVGRAGLAGVTLAHASYLINLAAPEGPVRRRSIAALADEIDRCDALGVPYLVLHPGSHVGTGEQAGLERLVDALDGLLDGRRGAPASRVTVLLENTAGQGDTLGHRFEQLGAVFAAARSSGRLGVCFDTCHALAAGYELRDRSAFRRTFAELDRRIGVERLRAFHLNDSLKELGSRRDRHTHIGHGALGLEPFRLLLADRRFRSLPMVLETPKGPALEEDRENLRVLRELLPASRR